MTTTNLSPNVPDPDHPSSTVSHEVERLPPEILGEIVKVSALSSLRQASILARVCNAFHSWTQPILLRTSFHFANQSWPLKSLQLSWFQQNGSHIRNLLWGAQTSSIDLLASILEHCPNLENLAVWVYAPTSNLPLIRPALSKLRLRELSINLLILFSTDSLGQEQAKDPMFRHITHLDVIIHKRNFLEWRQLVGLAYIPSLTHVALHKATPTAGDGVLEHCKNLQVLVVLELRPAAGPHESSAEVMAKKLVEYTPEPHARSTYDWEAGAMGKTDFWIEAEEEIANRSQRK
ncbi:hypothetical protein BDN72DRAFT_900382 [Pluteus cervinus]|uniref:Uncharacterized protein n=1 Tax=Pluteus cervinus TaxID=181527 RepID=A0ACD3AKQ1_9AGAR|nr:hypothetical protein BDN72DRAFT_900382 [Pluteus cervinus]